MELLPPVGCGNVATRRDVSDVRQDFGEVYKAMSRMMWTMTVSMIGTVVASAGLAFTAGVAL